MKLFFRTWILRSLLFAVPLLSSVTSQAETWPSRAITIVNPFAAGGTLDVFARLLAEDVSRTLGQPVIVENRPGANSTIGTTFVAKARPDGYTLLITAANIVSAPALGATVQYDWKTGFVPIMLLGSVAQAVAVPADLPVSTLQELVTYAKANPGQLGMGSLGPGSGSLINGKIFQQAAGITLIDVPFKGMAETMGALAGGHVHVAFGNLPDVLTYQRGGRIKAIAIAMPTRSPLAPDIPTLTEVGFGDSIQPPWYGVLAPGGTPPEVQQKLRVAISAALATPRIKSRMSEMAISPSPSSAEAFQKELQSEFDRYAAFRAEFGVGTK